jgi:hypothetical protein
VKDFWIKNDSGQLKDFCSGTTVLVKLKNLQKGMTCEGGHSVDISWIRSRGVVVATEGDYSFDEVSEFQVIK